MRGQVPLKFKSGLIVVGENEVDGEQIAVMAQNIVSIPATRVRVYHPIVCYGQRLMLTEDILTRPNLLPRLDIHEF